MAQAVQISATVSAETKKMLDSFTENFGLKKNYVVEQALLFFLAARRSLPDEALLPTRIVLDKKSFDQIVRAVDQPQPPTQALKDLMHGSADD